MATNTEISTAITTADALGISYSQLETLIKRSIAVGVTGDGRVIASTGANGVTVAFSSLESAISALEVIRRLAKLEDSEGGVIGLAEMVAE